jgi:hypothetical protein
LGPIEKAYLEHISKKNINFEDAYLPLTKGDRHLELCKTLNATYRSKNQDYGDSFGEQFKEYGEISAAIRLEDKLKRFKQLINNPAQVKDESKIDTLMDMANYAIMTVIEMEAKNG